MTPAQRKITQTLYAGGVVRYTNNGPVLAYYSQSKKISYKMFQSLLNADLIQLLPRQDEYQDAEYGLGPAWLLEVL